MRLGSTILPQEQPPFFQSADLGTSLDIPQHFVKAVQSGEFFELDKLLPHNLHQVASEAPSNVSFTLDKNDELKIVRNKMKKRITTISEWTDAFILFMKIFIQKFPARSSELINYLEIIRYAAAYHKNLGWLLYDRKFRAKAANHRALNWGVLDQQLWLRIFTASPGQLEEDLSLFIQGPPISSEGVATKGARICVNFNRGAECVSSPCPFRHVCNRPFCNAVHPGIRCPTSGGQLSFTAGQK